MISVFNFGWLIKISDELRADRSNCKLKTEN